MNEKFIYNTTEQYPLPKIGFKIHVSATLKNYKYIFAIVQSYLENKELHWKCLKSRDEFMKNISKAESPSESGKLFTIYPKNNAIAYSIMDDLSKLLKDYDGIYILSDKNFCDSKTVFYRYGFFQNTDNCILFNNGSKWKDYQKIYFDLPSWINDPFAQVKKNYSKVSMLEQYNLKKIIYQTNAGNIYYGYRKQRNKPIILKESRPNILASENILSSELRENEYKSSKILNSPHFLKPIEKFNSWINEYYCYEYFEGCTLNQWQRDFNLFENISEEKVLKFLHVIESLLKTIQIAHSNKIVLDDIHPNNFLINNDLDVCYIDLEYSHLLNGAQKITAKTPGYYLKMWDELECDVKDLRKLGQVVLYIINQLNIFESENLLVNEKICLVDALFKRFGYEINIKDFLKYLLIEGKTISGAISLFQKITYKKLINNKIDIIDLCELKNFDNIANLKRYISENTFYHYGLMGEAGYLWKLYKLEKKQSFLIDEKIKEICQNLKKSYLKIEKSFYSPYIANGSSGLGLFLMDYNFEKYKNTVVTIAEGMDVQVGKCVSFSKGLCGIAFF